MAGLYETAQVGKREDLADYITNVDQHNTPVCSRMKVDKKLSNTLFSQQANAYPSVNLDAVPDGKDADDWETLNNRALIQGVCEKTWRKPHVSDFAENVSDVAGLKSEMASEIRIALVMVKRDIEAKICAGSRELAVQGTSGEKAHKTRSLGVYIQNGAQSLYPVPSDFRPPSAQIDATATGSVVENTLKGIVKSVWDETGNTADLFVPIGSTLKSRIDTFMQTQPVSSSETVRRYKQEVGQIDQMVDVVRFSFGTLKFHLSNFLAADTTYGKLRAFILDMNTLSIRYARRPRVKPLEDQGGGPRALVDAIFALSCKNPRGLGKMAATS